MPENQSQEIELKLANGNVIKAPNAEEALKIAAKMIEDNSAAYRETKASLDGMQSQYQTMQQQIEALRPKETSTGFDKDKYYQLLHDDPLKAADYQDSYRFGVDNPREYLANLSQKVEILDSQTLAAGFVNQHPEFPQDADSAKAITDRMVALKNQGFPVVQSTMDLAWMQLQNEGKLKPLDLENQQQEELNPSLGGTGSGAIAASEVQKAEQMSTKELEAYLKSKGML